MTVAEIKVLPEEFDFYSNINEIMCGVLYHAIRNKNSYDITIKSDPNTYKWTNTTKEFNRSLLNGEYVLKIK